MMVGISHCNYSKQSRKQTADSIQETGDSEYYS